MASLTPRSAAAALLALLAGAWAVTPGEAQLHAQAILQQRIIVRITGHFNEASSVAQPALRWKEKKGPKCVAARAIAGASLSGENSVDLVLRDRSRVRAKLESSCPALDYYYGFYITPNPDGQVCADRDIIRSRMGGECGIDKFRNLETPRKD